MKQVIRNARIVNEGQIQEGDVLLNGDRIERIGAQIEAPEATEIDAQGQYLMPGIIDDQVHFRQPGLTHKADIRSESRAAAAGGVTSFMDMPNVKPASLTVDLLEERYAIASKDAAVNYSFYMGASNDNLEHVVQADPKNVCGIKIFMGSSTGNMLVDEEAVLDGLFARAQMIIATHCEDEARVRERSEMYRQKYGEEVPMSCHPEIRDELACLLSSQKAIALANKHNARLHILHISTSDELPLFEAGPLQNKSITSEACVHHLWFDASGYETHGSGIKCNPAIKDARHKPLIRQALLDDRIDVIATDHAPHTLEEKSGTYFKAPSGLPLVQHSLQVMLGIRAEDPRFDMPFIARKMSHAVADLFDIKERGYIREGYYADLILVDEKPRTIERKDVLYKCGWSPLEGSTFPGGVTRTFVNGQTVFTESDGVLNLDSSPAMRLSFDR